MSDIACVSDQQIFAVDLLNDWIKYMNDIAWVVQKLDIIRNKFPCFCGNQSLIFSF